MLLLGYRDQIEAIFQNVNPSLSRRFPISEAFKFKEFIDSKLKVILDIKLKQQGYNITNQGKRVAIDVLKRAYNRPNFRNAREVDILLNGAKARYQQRRTTRKVKDSKILEAVDIDLDFNRGE